MDDHQLTRGAGDNQGQTGPAPRVSPGDRRLVSALMMLGDEIPGIIAEVLAGDFDVDERRAFALVLCTLGAECDPGIVLPDAVASLPRGTGLGDVGADGAR